MKWFFGIVAVLVVGWIVAVQFFKHSSGGETQLQSTDSLQAKASSSTEPSGVTTGAAPVDSLQKNTIALPAASVIDTKNVQPQQVVSFAKTLMGVPYLYGSTDPAKGFDCSGFITYVFNHFGIAVPRSSIDFTNMGTEVSAVQAREGDLILFTGTDSTERFVGHMGIVVENTDSLRFIHSTSGKQRGVTITALNGYYQGRYVKTVRVFP